MSDSYRHEDNSSRRLLYNSDINSPSLHTQSLPLDNTMYAVAPNTGQHTTPWQSVNRGHPPQRLPQPPNRSNQREIRGCHHPIPPPSPYVQVTQNSYRGPYSGTQSSPLDSTAPPHYYRGSNIQSGIELSGPTYVAQGQNYASPYTPSFTNGDLRAMSNDPTTYTTGFGNSPTGKPLMVNRRDHSIIPGILSRPTLSSKPTSQPDTREHDMSHDDDQLAEMGHDENDKDGIYSQLGDESSHLAGEESEVEDRFSPEEDSEEEDVRPRTKSSGKAKSKASRLPEKELPKQDPSAKICPKTILSVEAFEVKKRLHPFERKPAGRAKVYEDTDEGRAEKKADEKTHDEKYAEMIEILFVAFNNCHKDIADNRPKDKLISNEGRWILTGLYPKEFIEFRLAKLVQAVFDAHNGIDRYTPADKWTLEDNRQWPTLDDRFDCIVDGIFKSKTACVAVLKFDEKIIAIASSPRRYFKRVQGNRVLNRERGGQVTFARTMTKYKDDLTNPKVKEEVESLAAQLRTRDENGVVVRESAKKPIFTKEPPARKPRAKKPTVDSVPTTAPSNRSRKPTKRKAPEKYAALPAETDSELEEEQERLAKRRHPNHAFRSQDRPGSTNMPGSLPTSQRRTGDYGGISGDQPSPPTQGQAPLRSTPTPDASSGVLSHPSNHDGSNFDSQLFSYDPNQNASGFLHGHGPPQRRHPRSRSDERATFGNQSSSLTHAAPSMTGSQGDNMSGHRGRNMLQQSMLVSEPSSSARPQLLKYNTAPNVSTINSGTGFYEPQVTGYSAQNFHERGLGMSSPLADTSVFNNQDDTEHSIAEPGDLTDPLDTLPPAGNSFGEWFDQPPYNN